MISRPAPIATVLIALLALAGCEAPKKPVATGPKVKIRETKGKTTQNVLKLADALAKGGVLAATGVTSTDYLGATSDVYKTSVAKIGAMAVDNAIRIRNASNIQEPKPLTYDEFMAEIIKKGQAEGINLAELPYYQEYAWDEAAQKLVVVEFPEMKKQLEKQEKEERGY